MSWKDEFKKQAYKDAVRMLEMAASLLQDACKVLDVRFKVIDALQTQPEAVFGTWHVLVRTNDIRVVHELAKTLRCTFRKVVDDDGWNYVTQVDGVKVQVFGFGNELFGCKIVPRKVMRESVEYEVVCK